MFRKNNIRADGGNGPERAGGPVIPGGWTREAWVGRLQEMADVCKGHLPRQAAEFRTEAARLRVERGS